MAAIKEKPEIKIKLSVVKGPHAGQVFQFNRDVINLGRGGENNVVLMNDPQISRSHAKITVLNNEIEVSNLSQKNALVVDGSNVQRWKLINNSSFVIGDSEIKVEYDLGRVVVSVPSPSVSSPKVLPTELKSAENIKSLAKPKVVKNARPVTKQTLAKSGSSARPQLPQTQMPRSVGMPAGPGMMQPTAMQNSQMQQANFDINASYKAAQAQKEKNASLMANPNFKFFLVALILIGAGYSYFVTPEKKASKIVSTLKYEDEINNRLVSKKEKDLEEDREAALKQKSSPQSYRVNESFIRGMRDFKLGNYVRAQEFFQVVLNLEPDHVLAKRHLFLSKVRFDELVNEKLLLGDSYYKKHNFRMCQSMYSQVMHMLESKSSEQRYVLAQKKAKECSLAEQGIR